MFYWSPHPQQVNDSYHCFLNMYYCYLPMSVQSISFVATVLRICSERQVRESTNYRIINTHGWRGESRSCTTSVSMISVSDSKSDSVSVLSVLSWRVVTAIVLTQPWHWHPDAQVFPFFQQLY